MTSKGQVTLPVALRRRLSIGTGDDLIFEETPQGTVIRVIHRQKLAAFLGALPVERVLDHKAEREAAAQRLSERHR